MLSPNKIILEQKLYKILYDAYMTQCSTDPEAGKYNGEINNAMMSAAGNFADKASGPCADAIYNFVKEIGINITVMPSVIAPPMPPTLPGGPCSGVIPMTDIIIS